jgi:disulfide bond formation protein DsbB
MPVLGLGCCLWLLGAGALAVWLYQRRIPGMIVTPGMGMRIGAVSGAIGYVATTVWSVLRFASNSQEFRTAMQEQMDKSLAANPDPRAQEIMRQFMGNLNTPQGLATFFVLILAIMAVVFVIFSAAGGALGASMFARRRDLR